MEIIKSFHPFRYNAERSLWSKKCSAPKKMNPSDMQAMPEIKWNLTTVLCQNYLCKTQCVKL
jgi:hypothetical protein